MRHRVYGKKLGRNKNERTALFKSLVQELVLHGTITTTEAKAKAVKGLVDKIITLAKSKTSARLLQSYFVNPLLQERLVKEIVPKLSGRTSGYTSLMKMGIREGDRSLMVKMSLIGAEELKPLEKVKPVEKKETIKKEVSEKKGGTGQSVRKTTPKKKGTSRLSKTK